MSGLIILLCIVLTVMMLPRLLRWWIVRSQRRFQQKMSDMFGGSYEQHRSQAGSRPARHTHRTDAATAEDAEFETIAGGTAADDPSRAGDDSDAYAPAGDNGEAYEPAGDTNPIVDAEFEQIP